MKEEKIRLVDSLYLVSNAFKVFAILGGLGLFIVSIMMLIEFDIVLLLIFIGMIFSMFVNWTIHLLLKLTAINNS